MVTEDLYEDGLVILPRLMTQAKLASSTSEARRLIKEGAVKIDGEKVTDPNLRFAPTDGMVIRAGKRRFARLSLKN